ncbi:hypothetical protein C8J57DRAFT_1463564 [Mycena rebaudengoi]|nr:hypothetical protein C8J57DRAFT_1463564 [Mycena rebaudengoi]
MQHTRMPPDGKESIDLGWLSKVMSSRFGKGNNGIRRVEEKTTMEVRAKSKQLEMEGKRKERKQTPNESIGLRESVSSVSPRYSRRVEARTPRCCACADVTGAYKTSLGETARASVGFPNCSLIRPRISRISAAHAGGGRTGSDFSFTELAWTGLKSYRT